MKKVEQITDEGLVTIDYDKCLLLDEIKVKVDELLSTKLVKKNRQLIYDNKISLLIKNITYLGNPHPIYKKRIQLPEHFHETIIENECNDLISMMVGVYGYTEKLVFAVFNVESYKGNKFNNSSAHVLTSDIYNARINGYFRKVDKNNNEILLLDENYFKKYMEGVSRGSTLEVIDEERLLMQYIEDFWTTIPDELFGIDCYKEMVDDQFSKAYEAEWIGFYNEFLFEKYLNKNPNELIQLYGNKKRGEIDLDLKINIGSDFYADLKAHNITSGIQGNKQNTIEELISVNGRLWYILTGFTPVMDKDKKNEVADYWREAKEKFNAGCKSKSKHKSTKLGSYYQKMKHSVKVDEFYILEITADKVKFISQYNQGVNSDGNERTPKIGINKRNIEMLSILHKKRKKV